MGALRARVSHRVSACSGPLSRGYAGAPLYREGGDVVLGGGGRGRDHHCPCTYAIGDEHYPAIRSWMRVSESVTILPIGKFWKATMMATTTTPAASAYSRPP